MVTSSHWLVDGVAHDRATACDALQKALWRRKRPENVIVHTDRGGQYCSAAYQTLLKRHNLRGSMSTKGCCYGNVCMESFFHSLKVECTLTVAARPERATGVAKPAPWPVQLKYA